MNVWHPMLASAFFRHVELKRFRPSVAGIKNPYQLVFNTYISEPYGHYNTEYWGLGVLDKRATVEYMPRGSYQRSGCVRTRP